MRWIILRVGGVGAKEPAFPDNQVVGTDQPFGLTDEFLGGAESVCALVEQGGKPLDLHLKPMRLAATIVEAPQVAQACKVAPHVL